MTRCPYHHAGGLVRSPAGFLAAGGALAGALVLNVDGGEPERLDDRVVGWEVAAGLDDLAKLVVQRLDGYLELWRQPKLWPAAFRRGQCHRRDARGLILAVSASLIVTCSGPNLVTISYQGGPGANLNIFEALHGWLDP
jgi:hypothetical protein